MVKFNRRYSIYFFVTLLVLIFMSIIRITVVNAEKINVKKSVAIVLDVSGSMKDNDLNRLIIDSIGRFIYSLPSDYDMNVVLYNSDVVLNEYAISLEDREKIVHDIEKIEYQGYTNTGFALSSALDYLEKSSSNEKIVILLSDGDILMETEGKTGESLLKFNEGVSRAKNIGIPIHIIGTGKMFSEDNLIFSAAIETGGNILLLKTLRYKKFWIRCLQNN